MRYFYVGKYKANNEQKDIYCDEFNGRFYVVNKTFENLDDGLIYFYDLMDKNYQNEEMKPYEIKDPGLLLTLKSAYVCKKTLNINEAQARLNEKSKIQMKNKQKIYIAELATIVLISLRSFVYYNSTYLLQLHYNNKIKKSLTEEQKLENFECIYNAIRDNKTISFELHLSLVKDFTVIRDSDVPLFEEKLSEIVKRIETYDFTGLDSTNYLFSLEEILFGEKNPINKCVVSSLDSYANNKDNTIAMMFGELTTPMNEPILDTLFAFGDKALIKRLATYYGVKDDKIEETIELLDAYTNSTDEEEKNYLYMLYQKNVAALLMTYYKNVNTVSEFSQFVLASQMFDGDYIVDNNIFSSVITITHSSRKYESYTKYYDFRTKADISMAFYREKLVELIRSKGNKLDYNDPDCRFLLYLYNLCYQDFLSNYNKDLLEMSSAEELADLIINDVFDENMFTQIRKEFLYTYFTCGKICLDDMLPLKTDEDTLSVALFVDIVNCLKKENYLKKEDYNRYVQKELINLEKANKELYNDAILALENDTSLFERFGLLSNEPEYKNTNIEKYVLHQKYPY